MTAASLRKLIIHCLPAAVCCVLFSFHTAFANPPVMGPVQPSIGIGGSCYPHEGLTKWQKGINRDRYQVFEPAGPAVKKAGFVLLVHDFLAYDPEFYAGLIRHLCRRGWVVLFPHYQGTGDPTGDYLPNIVRSTKDFLMEKFTQGTMTIDRERFIIIGHGSGAVLAANTAATADYFGLPAPHIIFAVTPTTRCVKLLDLTGISRTSRMVVISGDEVLPDNHQMAREIFYAADRVKTDNKIFLTVLSDYSGQPPLIADELAGLSPEKPLLERLIVKRRNEFISGYKRRMAAGDLRAMPIDAFDWFVLFRSFDALTVAQPGGSPKLNIFLKSSEMRSLGYWSNGKKLKNMIATDRP